VLAEFVRPGIPILASEEGVMLTYKPAQVEQYEEFLQLMRNEVEDYVERTMELMQMTWEEYTRLFKTLGQVYGVYQGGQLAGFYWIEERERVLHLHGLILKEPFRGQGIGTQVLDMLATRYRTGMTSIELGVHESNQKARRLYERLGFETMRTLDDLGFLVMQKRLANGVNLK
jgi:ribosomal protein S18 acetylase RimI-like enzyme